MSEVQGKKGKPNSDVEEKRNHEEAKRRKSFCFIFFSPSSFDPTSPPSPCVSPSLHFSLSFRAFRDLSSKE